MSGYEGSLATAEILYSFVVTDAYSLDARDRPALLFSMMRTFASELSHIALEGNLAATELFTLEGASYDETEVLRRATIAPRLDFVVLPLVPTRVPEIQQAIRSKIAFSGYRGIIHAQIEACGELVFGAYDNFHRETVMVYGTIERSLLDGLVKARTLRSYAPVLKRAL
jgi:hypothetical protein